MKNVLNGSKCIQYADDSSIYCSCNIKNIDKCPNEIENDLNTVKVKSKDRNLIFNPSKKKRNAYIITTDGAISPIRQFQLSTY